MRCEAGFVMVLALLVLLMVDEEDFVEADAIFESYGLNVNLCGPAQEVALKESNISTVATVSFDPDIPLGVCVLRVTAPSTHLVYLKFVETTTELYRARTFNETSYTPPCPLSIFLPQNRNQPVWTGNPCSTKDLQEIDLLPSNFRIVWRSSSSATHTKGRKLVLTAVGKGAFCKTAGQHICSRIGWEPDSCVADSLRCDRNENCPKGSSYSDENETDCKSHLLQGSWEQFVVEVMRKMKSPSQLMQNKWLKEKLQETTTTKEAPRYISWEEFRQRNEVETTTKETPMPSKPNTVESITEVLSQYGPWGYLMLGMLICGTVLMFCGLWECCFHRPKTQEDDPLPAHPTTVLIINQPDEEASRPPSYEELDQPPSYSTLFPHVAKIENADVSEEVSEVMQLPDEGAVAVTVVVTAESSGGVGGAEESVGEGGVKVGSEGGDDRTHQED